MRVTEGIERHAVSVLSLGEGGWIMKAVFIVSGLLTIAWGGNATDPVMMTGPATTVFEGRIHIPD